MKIVFAYYKTSAIFFLFCPQHVSFYQNIENTGVVTDVNYFVHLDNHPFEELCSEVATKPWFINFFFFAA